MEIQTKRPFLLAGLIINIVCFAILSISGIINIFTVAAALSGLDVSGSESAIIFVFLIYILLLAFCILGIVFSAISITRLKLSPTDFAKKRGMIITAFVFNIIIVLLTLIGLTSAFNAVSLVMMIILICAAVFIMLDIVKNNKLIEEQAKADMTEASTTVQQTEAQQTTATNSEVEKTDKE